MRKVSLLFYASLVLGMSNTSYLKVSIVCCYSYLKLAAYQYWIYKFCCCWRHKISWLLKTTRFLAAVFLHDLTSASSRTIKTLIPIAVIQKPQNKSRASIVRPFWGYQNMKKSHDQLWLLAPSKISLWSNCLRFFEFYFFFFFDCGRIWIGNVLIETSLK